MSKKVKAFNMSAAIRAILSNRPKITSDEMKGEILSLYPGVTINQNSFGVAFYTARQKMGLTKKRRAKNAAKSVAESTPVRRTAIFASHSMTETMVHAFSLVKQCGNFDAAHAAINALKSLQVE